MNSMRAPLKTVTSVLEYWSEQQPEKTFLFAPEPHLEMTYAELINQAKKWMHWFEIEGISPKAHIGLYMHNGYQTTNLFISTMVTGRVITPFNLLAHQEQLEYVLRHSDIEVLFYSSQFKEQILAIHTKTNARFKLVEVEVDSKVNVNQHLAGIPLKEIDETQAGLLMYTSGTTGTPKGVILSHQNLIHAASSLTTWHGLSEADIVLSSLPIYHINGQVISTLTPLYSGGGIVSPHHFSVKNWWQYAVDYKVTWINMVPTIIAYLINAQKNSNGQVSKELLQHIRFGRSASAPLPQEQHKEFEELFGVQVIEGMGMTETASMVFCNPHDSRRRYGSPGLPCGVEAKIVDSKGNRLDTNQVGEIYLRGPNVLRSYYKNPIETQNAFDGDWLKTGDLGTIDEDGFYRITGRLKELIIKGGENIAPREIDEILLQHPSVLDAAVVGIPDQNYGQEILACIMLKQGSPCSEGDLRGFCLDMLGKFRTPKKFIFVDDLPRGPSGKVQRLKLLDLNVE